jgi:hypothetical protein
LGFRPGRRAFSSSDAGWLLWFGRLGLWPFFGELLALLIYLPPSYLKLLSGLLQPRLILQ